MNDIAEDNIRRNDNDGQHSLLSFGSRFDLHSLTLRKDPTESGKKTEAR